MTAPTRIAAAAGRRWGTVVLSVLLTTAVAAWAARLLPERYESTFRLRVEGPGVDKSDLAIETERMTSRSVFEDLTDAPHRGAVEELAERVTATAPPGDANLVEATCEGSRPADAHDLCAGVLARYLQLRGRLQSTAMAAEAGSFEGQLRAVQGRLQAAEDSLESYRRATSVAALDREPGGDRGVRAREAHREELRRQLKAVTELSLDLEWGRVGDQTHRDLSNYPPPLRTGPVPGLVEELAELENRRAMLTAAGGGDDPYLPEVDRKIESVAGGLRSIVIEHAESLKSEIRSLDTWLAKAGDQPVPRDVVMRLEQTIAQLAGERRALEARLEETEPAAVRAFPPVRVVAQASLPAAPTRLRPTSLLLLGLLLGLALGVAVALRRERAAVAARPLLPEEAIGPGEPVGPEPAGPGAPMCPEEPVHAEKLPVLGSLPFVTDPGPVHPVEPRVLSGLVPREPPDEADRWALHAALEGIAMSLDAAGGASGGIRSLAITSTARGEGSTCVACNLALVRAAHGHRILLVDADPWGHGVDDFFRLSQSKDGLIEVLTGRTTIDEARVVYRVGENGELSVLPAGNPFWLTAGVDRPSAFGEELRRAEACYDLIIVDTSPLTSIEEGIAAEAADAVILVVRSRPPVPGAVDHALQRLVRPAGRVMGVVLNGVKTRPNRPGAPHA